MRRTGAVKDHGRLCRDDCSPYRVGVQQVHAVPSHTLYLARSTAAGPVPGDGVAAAVCGEEVEEMTAGEARSSSDQGGTGGTGHRGVPLSPPLNGEKLPRPASVNDRKNRWSDATVDRPAKLYR